MNIKKIIVIVIVICLIAVAALGVAYLLKGNNMPSAATGTGALPQVSQNSPTPIPGPSATPASSTGSFVAAAGAPQGALLSLGTAQGTVQVNNFYLSDPPTDNDGDLILQTNADYSIVYDRTNSSFWIAITGSSFDGIRPEAEAAFLQLLGVSQNDVCKLDASEGIPYAPNNPLDGQSFPLSFCT